MHELNKVIDEILSDNVEKIRDVIKHSLIVHLVDGVMLGIAKQFKGKDAEIIEGVLNREELIEYCLTILSSDSEETDKLVKRKENYERLSLAIDCVIDGISELIKDGDLKVEGVIDKNKLLKTCKNKQEK